MKKNILLVLLSAVLLTGCEFDITLQRLFSGRKKEQETQQNNENSQEKPEENQQSGENQSEQGGGDQGGNQQGNEGQEQLQEYTVKINTSGSDFNTISSSAGFQIDDSNYQANAGKLKDYFESKLEYENLLTNLACSKLNTAVWKSVCYLCVGTGYYVNDKFVEGLLKWTSGEKIYKVEIEAMAYAKEYSGSDFGVDTISHVWIDSDDHSLETDAEPVMQTFSKEYADGVNSFSIKSTGSRVLLKSLTITWRG